MYIERRDLFRRMRASAKENGINGPKTVKCGEIENALFLRGQKVMD